MKTTVVCPECQQAQDFETDTGLADNGDVYHDTCECSCGSVFVARTTIKMIVDVLRVNAQPVKPLALLFILLALPACTDVRVIDGDTIVLNGDRIRLAGIDAPELSQPCRMGPKAAEWLGRFIEGKAVTCIKAGKSYNRIVARCAVDGVDLQDALVRSGQAFDSLKYSRGKYSTAEAEAKRLGLGIHAAECEKPWIWRERNR